MLSMDVSGSGAENGQEGGESKSGDASLEAAVQAGNKGPSLWLCQENRTADRLEMMEGLMDWMWGDRSQG